MSEHNTKAQKVQKLQKDVDSILNDFKEFLEEREEEEGVKVHLDVDLVLQKIANPFPRTQKQKEIFVKETQKSHNKSAHLYNPEFYLYKKEERKSLGKFHQVTKLIFR